MRPDDLIDALVIDNRPTRGAVVWTMGASVLLAVAGSSMVMALGWGVRPDLESALATGPFWMKAGYTATFGLAGVILVERIGRPGVSARAGWWLIGAALAVISALAASQLLTTPSDQWVKVTLGESWRQCPWRIAAIALPAFATALWALRRMAPTRPRLAGAAAGLMAGGIGATIYGFYCQETAAAFTAVWYTLGMLVWAAVGAFIGDRVLRW
jgi:hypothetical protein